jgi:hypothetical protein
MRFVDRDGGCRIAEINALHLSRPHSIWNGESAAHTHH